MISNRFSCIQNGVYKHNTHTHSNVLVCKLNTFKVNKLMAYLWLQRHTKSFTLFIGTTTLHTF